MPSETARPGPQGGAPRRFYREVRVEAQGDGSASEGYVVLLDGRHPKSPQAKPLRLPTRDLADAVAQEWAAQEEVVLMSRMPLTRLAFTVLDRAEATREALATEMVRFADHDLLCYRADAPKELRAEEDAAWDPWLSWARTHLGVTLTSGSGVMHRPQAPEGLDVIFRRARDADAFRLMGLSFAAALYGSAVLAFAVSAGALASEAALELAFVDERFQARLWGEDEEAAARRAALAREAQMIGVWFRALGPG